MPCLALILVAFIGYWPQCTIIIRFCIVSFDLIVFISMHLFQIDPKAGTGINGVDILYWNSVEYRWSTSCTDGGER